MGCTQPFLGKKKKVADNFDKHWQEGERAGRAVMLIHAFYLVEGVGIKTQGKFR